MVKTVNCCKVETGIPKMYILFFIWQSLTCWPVEFLADLGIIIDGPV